MSSSSQNPDRDGYIAGLRELADWLEQHPAVEVPYVKDIAVVLNDNPRVAEFAAAAGVEVETDKEGNTKARVEFGPLTYFGYGYADWGTWSVKHDEKRAHQWADQNDMVLQPREAGDES